MFVLLFEGLRARGVPVSIQEWLVFLESLARGLHRPTLDDLYAIGRATLVKHEAHFDAFDQVFLELFAGAAATPLALDKVLEWLSQPSLPRPLPAIGPAELHRLTDALDELRKKFEERLAEQKEKHEGGSHWVGTGGTSAFGSGGSHPNGVRVGPQGGGSMAMQVAAERRFREYRSDQTLDIRALQVALKRLRKLRRTGAESELDVDESVDATCRNAGELELIFARPRQNDAKLLLLLDAGGSMTPHARLVSALFSALHGLDHFKAFRHYTFHNCVYETLFEDISQRKGIPTAEVLRELPEDTHLIVVGDAYMHPAELLASGGAIDYWHHNETPGIEWLRKLNQRFSGHVWLNPLPARYWTAPSVSLVGGLYPMFPLSVDGIGQAVTHLLTAARVVK